MRGSNDPIYARMGLVYGLFMPPHGLADSSLEEFIDRYCPDSAAVALEGLNAEPRYLRALGAFVSPLTGDQRIRHFVACLQGPPAPLFGNGHRGRLEEHVVGLTATLLLRDGVLQHLLRLEAAREASRGFSPCVDAFPQEVFNAYPRPYLARAAWLEACKVRETYRLALVGFLDAIDLLMVHNVQWMRAGCTPQTLGRMVGFLLAPQPAAVQDILNGVAPSGGAYDLQGLPHADLTSVLPIMRHVVEYPARGLANEGHEAPEFTMDTLPRHLSVPLMDDCFGTFYASLSTASIWKCNAAGWPTPAPRLTASNVVHIDLRRQVTAGVWSRHLLGQQVNPADAARWHALVAQQVPREAPPPVQRVSDLRTESMVFFETLANSIVDGITVVTLLFDDGHSPSRTLNPTDAWAALGAIARQEPGVAARWALSRPPTSEELASYNQWREACSEADLARLRPPQLSSLSEELRQYMPRN